MNCVCEVSELDNMWIRVQSCFKKKESTLYKQILERWMMVNQAESGSSERKEREEKEECSRQMGLWEWSPEHEASKKIEEFP